ncbi:hypothetical protein BST86_09330 [Nonlabens agnitus]|uniref:Uncharacterized protein n=2 Tax=Nonlabens agnitus TaxID=870484 RepID=A0A2S9WUZ9_9FLAO|nr:hypothetical protein BST86_09330 [Nonlabens agnitus]
MESKDYLKIEEKVEKQKTGEFTFENIDRYDKLIDSLVNLYPDPISKFNLRQVSCKNLNDDFLNIYYKDQKVRNEGVGNMETVDHENLQNLVSIIEKCGFPKSGQLRDFRGYLGIFVVLQHSDPEWIAFYYNDFKDLVNNGSIPRDFLALLQDRFLLLNDQPQIYGTQMQNGKLYKLVDPESVGQRRRNMGFTETLSVYLSKHGLKLKDELKRLSSIK